MYQLRHAHSPRSPLLIVIVVAATMLLVWPHGAMGQSGASLSASTDPFYRYRPLEPGDSLAVFRAVRSRQFAFERFRRQNFPQAESRSRVECDDIIGRFCYNHDEPEGGFAPEADDVLAARRALIAALDTAAEWQPGDSWIAAQRIRYLVEDEQFDSALAVAERCGVAETWWCYAFSGYVKHGEGDFAAAEGFFDRALAAMPEQTRCHWTNLVTLLPEGAREDYADLECDERATENARLWWLTDPLYMVAGNERRSEHFARQVLNKILERAESGYGVYWETDLGALVTRYGWPAGWERVMIGPNDTWQETAIVSRHPSWSKSFVPNSRILDDPFRVRWFEWDLDDPEARERYAPGYATRFDYLADHQVVTFLRGDSVLAVGAFAWPDTSQFDAAVVWTTGPDQINVEYHPAASGRVGLMTRGPATPALLSLEALDRSARSASRIRFSPNPPTVPEGGLGVSEILLFDPVDPVPAELPDVVPLARAHNRIRRGTRLGLYWEVYGSSAAEDSLLTSVTVVRGGRSFLSGLAQRVGLGPNRGPEVTIDWVEPGGLEMFGVPRSMAVDLADLAPGEYTIRIEMTGSSGRTVVEKEIVILE